MAGMLASKLSSSGLQIVEALRFPLRLRVVGGAETPSDTFRAWAWEGYHRSFMGPWATVVISYICLLLRDMQGVYQAITISLMGLTALSLAATSFNLVPFIKREDQHKWARYLIIQFSALQITLTWILAFEGHYVGDSLIRVCTYWLDTFTNLGVTVPNLAMADWSTGEWIVYVLAHISSSAPLFVNRMNYSIPFAIFKVVVIQSLGLFVYMTMERSKFTLFFVQLRKQQQRLEKKLAHLDPDPSAAGSSAESTTQPHPSSADSRGKIAPEQPLARRVQKECQAEYGEEHPLYKPVLRGHKVLIKIHADIDPEELTASMHCQDLYQQITASFNNCVMVETAARRGCLMLSLHLCELLRLAQQQPEQRSLMQRPATELKLAEEVASSTLTWLDVQAQLMNGLQDRLVDGTIVSVQVNMCTFRGVWNSSTRALELTPDAGPPSPILEALYSITFTEPAFLLPQPCHLPALQNTDTHAQRGNSPSADQPAASVAPAAAAARASTAADGASAAAAAASTAAAAAASEAPAAAALMEAEIQGSRLQATTTTTTMHLPTSKYASSITLGASFCVPSGSPELVGWQEKSPEVGHATTVNADKLVVLASARGWCLPVTITQQPEWQIVPSVDEVGGADEEERKVQVCISLPQDLLTSSHCLRLELVSNSILLCSRNVLLLDSRCAEVQQEIKDWALPPQTPAQVAAFVDDLAEFLCFQSLWRSDTTSGTAKIAEGAGTGSKDAAEGEDQNGLLDALAAEARRPEMDLMMGEVGLELLHHAISWGMASLAEHLLTALMARPLSLPFAAIACGRLPHIHHTLSLDSSAAGQEQEQETPHKQHQELDAHAAAVGQKQQEPDIRTGNWTHEQQEPPHKQHQELGTQAVAVGQKQQEPDTRIGNWTHKQEPPHKQHQELDAHSAAVGHKQQEPGMNNSSWTHKQQEVEEQQQQQQQQELQITGHQLQQGTWQHQLEQVHQTQVQQIQAQFLDSQQQQQQLVLQGPDSAAQLFAKLQACTDAAFLGERPSIQSSQATAQSCQSLLTLALLSYNRRSLARVLEWGRLHGGPQGHAWEWDAVDACGYSPSQIMQRMPPEHPLLQLLLSDETAATAAARAQQVAQQMRESLAKYGSGSSSSSGRTVRGQGSGAQAPSASGSRGGTLVHGHGHGGTSFAQDTAPVGVAREKGGLDGRASGSKEAAAAAAAAAGTAAAAGKAARPPLAGNASRAPCCLLHGAMGAVLVACLQLVEAVLRMCGKCFSQICRSFSAAPQTPRPSQACAQKYE